MNELRTILVALAAATLTVASVQAAPSTAFTYQGQLKSSGVPYTGPASFEFSLWDAALDGHTVAEPVRVELDVVDGLFTAPLDFGMDAFNGDPRWLEITVHTDRDGAVLTPRQPITPAPLALYALNAPAGSSTGFALPYAGSTTSNEVALAVAQHGAAGGGAFVIDNAANNQPAMSLVQAGSGPALLSLTGAGGGIAGAFITQGVDNAQSTVKATNNASGHAGQFKATRDGSHMSALLAENDGSGSAGEFIVGWDPDPDPENGNTAAAVTGTNDAWGSAGWFNISNAANDADVLWASGNGAGTSILGSTTGTGAAGRFVISNTSNTSAALAGETNGSGQAVSGVTTGTGPAAYLQTDNAGSTSQTLKVVSNGRASAGFFQSTNTANTAATVAIETAGDNNALFADARGTGDAVFGHNAFGGDAVVGLVEGNKGNAGSFSIVEPTNADPALLATTAGFGPAARFESTGVAQALDVTGHGVQKEALRAENVNQDRGIAAFFRNNSSESTMIIVNAGFGPLVQLANSTAQVVAQIGQAGQVWASRFEYSTPKTHTMSFGPADFQGAEVDVNRGARFICVDTNLNSNYSVFAAVHLPDGATITSFSFAADDENTTRDLTMTLGRTSLNGDRSVGLARLDTAGSSGVMRLETAGVLYNTVDNDNYTYYISVNSAYAVCDSRCCWPNGLSVLGAVITYTTSEAD